MGYNAGVGPTGGGIISANFAGNVGLAFPTIFPGYSRGISGTYNILGTDPGWSETGISKAGTPLAYTNLGANVGFSTPSLYSCGSQ